MRNFLVVFLISLIFAQIALQKDMGGNISKQMKGIKPMDTENHGEIMKSFPIEKEEAEETEQVEEPEETEETEEPEQTEETEETEEPEQTEETEQVEEPEKTEETEETEEPEKTEETEETEEPEQTEETEQVEEPEKTEETEKTEEPEQKEKTEQRERPRREMNHHGEIMGKYNDFLKFPVLLKHKFPIHSGKQHEQKGQEQKGQEQRELKGQEQRENHNKRNIKPIAAFSFRQAKKVAKANFDAKSQGEKSHHHAQNNNIKAIKGKNNASQKVKQFNSTVNFDLKGHWDAQFNDIKKKQQLNTKFLKKNGDSMEKKLRAFNNTKSADAKVFAASKALKVRKAIIKRNPVQHDNEMKGKME